MICENCGGEIVPEKTYSVWISGKCSNCKMSYSWRKTKEEHEATLRFVYGEYYEAKMKEFEKRLKELTQNAAV